MKVDKEQKNANKNCSLQGVNYNFYVIIDMYMSYLLIIYGAIIFSLVINLDLESAENEGVDK